MKIIVPVKYSLNVYELKIDPSTRKPQLEAATYTLGDIDKNAIEEAIRIKEKQGGQVIAVCLGPEKAALELKRALAMGADEAYLITLKDTQYIDTRTTSKILAKFISDKLKEFDLIICGELSLDGISGQIGPRLAELLGIPIITHVRRIISLGDGKIVVERDAGDSYETVETMLPAIITVTKEINEPRIPSLRMIMLARKKPLHKIALDELMKPEGNTIDIISIEAPKMERKKIIIKEENIDEAVKKLVEYLRKEGVI